MKPFTIGEVRDIFAADLARIQAETAELILHALANPGSVPDLTLARRHAHTMKGMSSLVRAEALTRWASDLEGLFAHAEEIAPGSPADAATILRWIVDRLPEWMKLADLTVQEKFSEADTLYARIHTELNELLASRNHEVVPQPVLRPPQFKLEQPTPPLASPKDHDTQRMVTPPTPSSQQGSVVPKVVAPVFKPAAPIQPAPALPEGPHPQPVALNIATPQFKKAAIPTPLQPSPVPTPNPSPAGSTNKVPGIALVTPRFKAAAPTPVAPSPAEAPTIPEAPQPALNTAFPTTQPQAPTPPQTPAKPATPASAPRPKRDRSAEMLNAFALDAQDQLECLERAILLLDKKEDMSNQLALARRSFHTLKGAANSVGFATLGTSFHEVEDFVELTTQTHSTDLPKGFCSFLLACVDDLRQHLQNAESGTASEWKCDWKEWIAQIQSGQGMPERKAASAPTTAPTQNPSAPAGQPSSANEEAQTIRVDARRLRKLLNLMGELVIDRSRLERQLTELSQDQDLLKGSHGRIMQLVQAFQKEFEFSVVQNRTNLPGSNRFAALLGTTDSDSIATSHDASTSPGKQSSEGFSELEFDRYDRFNVLSRQLTEVANDLEETILNMRSKQRDYLSGHQKFARTSKQMQEEATGLTLQPVQSLFRRLERVFRDALQAEHKEAELHFEGENTLVDKAILDSIYPPLLHLVRNSVAHGLESPDEREKIGKPRKGNVRISAIASGNNVLIDVTDDGRGIHSAKVRTRAIERGLIPASSPEELPFTDVLALLFTPGFSTSDSITSVAGRGVGLDVVQADLESVGGTIEISSKPAEGSRWTVRLPLTLSVAEALIGKSHGQKFAFPIQFLESALVLNPDSLKSNDQGRMTYTHGNTVLPAFYLTDLLGGGERPTACQGLVLHSGTERGLLLLDQGFTTQEIVVKPLDSILMQHPMLSAGTVDTDGSVFFIMNVPALLQAGNSGFKTGASASATLAAMASRRAATRPRVLIVDDSLSVRKVQERILTDLGCEVYTANDGLQALERLREHEFKLVITDLEMPGMDGYQLITEIRSQKRFSDMPIAVVSSRSTVRYTDRAMALGANICLAKPFTEDHIDSVLDQYVRLKSEQIVAA